jgi:xylose isomerase
VMKSMVTERYLSWSINTLGTKIENGEASLEDCVDYAKSKGEPTKISGKQELYEMIRNGYIYG